jgi:hypothetical protein
MSPASDVPSWIAVLSLYRLKQASRREVGQGPSRTAEAPAYHQAQVIIKTTPAPKKHAKEKIHFPSKKIHFSIRIIT